jgi:peptidoglycan hydrolase-like protein with peptidoglycan-binding domain
MALTIGSRSENVKAVQEMLNFLGTHVPSEGPEEDDFVPLVADGDFGRRTQLAVIAFQQDHGLLADGQIGPGTLQLIEDEYRTTLMSLASPGTDSVEQSPLRLTFERAPADVYKQGYGAVWLRSDTAARYRVIYEATRTIGAKITSSGGKRDLQAPVSAGRSATSFHYTGRALDLFLYSGMVNPASDPYVVVREPEDPLLHRVYARCAEGNGNRLTLSQVVTYKDRTGNLSAAGTFIDLTALFEAQGFKRIRARPNFPQGGSEIGAEWWHFQDETGLVKGNSTFGDELLKVYSEATLRAAPPWKFKDRVFGVNWG